MSFVRVSIIQTAGSAPREAGTQMLVYPDRIVGTIGGGALEWDAMQRARRMLATAGADFTETVALGPALGQCCGGSVKMSFARNLPLDTTTERPVWIYGAGHVGRALAQVISQLPDTSVTLIDTEASRFPDPIENVTPLIASDPALAVKHAPPEAQHFILTYSHDLDLAVCHAILSHSFATAGLIGSATKWVRFRKRLTALGHSEALINRIACPIGDPSLGKHPMQIAIGVASAMIATDQATSHKGAA